MPECISGTELMVRHVEYEDRKYSPIEDEDYHSSAFW